MSKAILTFSTLLILLALVPPGARAATSVDRLLEERVGASPLALTPVMITFDHQPSPSDFDALRALGISGGYVIGSLPIVQTAVNAQQLAALRGRAGVLSLYADHRLELMDEDSRAFIGQRALETDSQVRDNGLPMSGKGVIIAHVDTGIDGTHPDVEYGKNVTGNVIFPAAGTGAAGRPDQLPSDFVPFVYLEDQPLTDLQGGHGTFGAAVAAGIGQASGGRYAGVAMGADLLGLVAGNDSGLSSFAVVQAYGYILVRATGQNIRVCNSAFGAPLADYPYDPFDPVNVATRQMHDSLITVVFAAGNDGDRPGAINTFSVAPWVISVAAGEKWLYGAPASFSSRGNDDGTGADVAGLPADPFAPPNLRPDITGSGVNIVSARAKGVGLTSTGGLAPLVGNDGRMIAPGFLPYYTVSNGTSFAAAQVSGVVAVMTQANPLLTPDDVVTLLRNTATPMPHAPRVAGAGYVDAHNAVRAARSLAAVAHPANLTPPAGTPEIVDAINDHGTAATGAQDIVSADFYYNPASRQARYTLTLADLSQRSANNQWRINSNFFGQTVFVSAAQLETGQMRYRLGTISRDSAGVPVQTTIPSGVDAGTVSGNQIIIWVSIDKISAAVGRDVYGATSTETTALSQLLAGANGAGALVDADVATGLDFRVN